MGELTFQDELRRQPLDLLRASLLLARLVAYPQLDLLAYQQQVDELAGQAQRWLTGGLSPRQQGELLSDFLFMEKGFQGNARDYTDPRNSYLNEVLERRLGIPISLSVLYMAIARRLGIPVQGIGLPGHFVVRLGADCYLDPYHGGERISSADCAHLVAQSTGSRMPFNPDWLQPISAQAILTRMLNNLRSSYLRLEDWPHAAAVVEHLRLLHPGLADLLHDLGRIYHQQGRLGKAIDCYERYLALAPEASNADLALSQLQAAARSLARRN